ncbi:MAG: stage III sporulation protein AD [Clostridia bacterium]|nr:stage III sporulation protein AD [Clostridia bacterium]
MSIIKVIGIAILGMVCAGLLKEIKPSLASFAGVITGVVILFTLTPELNQLIVEFKKIAEIAKVDSTLLVTIIKIIGIGYLTEFTASITEDYGVGSIGKKVLLAGKILIMLLAIPIISNVVLSIGSILK